MTATHSKAGRVPTVPNGHFAYSRVHAAQLCVAERLGNWNEPSLNGFPHNRLGIGSQPESGIMNSVVAIAS